MLVTIKKTQKNQKTLSEVFECFEGTQNINVINQLTSRGYGNVTLGANVSEILVYVYGPVLVTHYGCSSSNLNDTLF